MIKKTFKIASFLFVLVAAENIPLRAQSTSLIQPATNGTVAFSARKMQIPLSKAITELNQLLGLSNDFNFVRVKERTDKNGIMHTAFEQLYKGVKVNDAKIIIHSKAGLVRSITGKTMQSGRLDLNLNLNPSLSLAKAKEIVSKDLQLLPGGKIEDLGLVVFMNEGNNNLAFKLKTNARNLKNVLTAYNVLVDAHTGAILARHSLIANADAPATASTFYSGTRDIMTESVDGIGYRLRDNTRNIETYDVAGLMPSEGSVLFPDARDITNTSTTWEEKPYIMAMELSMADPEIITNLGISFSTFAGNVLSNTVERDSDGEVLGRNNYLGLDGGAAIPFNNANLFIPAVEGETYTGRFFKDSISIDFMTGFVEFRGTHESSAASFPITTTDEGTFPWADDEFNAGSYTISMQSHPAIDIHWGISRTYDFYDENFDYLSYDGEGGIIRNYYNGTAMLVGTQNNAAALQSPYNAMVYGTGDGVDFHPFVTLDVTAHEFSHLIMSNTADLNYEGESGALNEAFSDIMGTAVEFFAKGEEANWTIGENLCITIPYMRSMSDPNAPAGFTGSSAMAIPQPDTYRGDFWAPTGSADPDNGGVHINSGVANYWYYLLSEGGSGTNDLSNAYNVPAIGIEKATNIAFNTFTAYLTSSSDFHAAYLASLEATADIYGEESEELDAVEKAWYAVGIPYSTSVQNVPAFAKNLNIYPNPNNGTFTINNESANVLHAEMSNILGAVVNSFTVKQGLNEMNVNELPAGTYFINFRSLNGESYANKVVIK